MLMIIIVTSLVTILTLIISSMLYLVSFISVQADDTDDTDSLAIDTHDFRTSPATSPVGLLSSLNCENPNHHHHICYSSNGRIEDEFPATIGGSNSLQGNNQEANDATRPTRPDAPSVRDIEDQTGPKEQQSVDDIKISTWSTTASAQKTIIANQLGTPLSKQLFDDFDPKEVQLGGTGLHWCKTRKSLDRLVKLGLPLDIVNKKRETALHVAVRRKKLPILIGLLCHGAQVDCINENGETPLLLSCKLNEVFACQLLLIFDANVDSTDKNGLSSRHYAAAICDKHKVQQNPQNQANAAHLILAMLNEMGAERCSRQSRSRYSHLDSTNTLASGGLPGTKGNQLSPCTDGCSYSGSYNGNSYNRWPDFQKESLYRRHMFSDILESRRRKAAYGKSEGPRSSRLFCIDGGGMRGVIVCQMMIEMEKFLAKPMINYFDWVGGTSVGGFLACALCVGVSLRDLRRTCFDVKDEVFSGNKPYNSKYLERVIKRTLGASTRMSDIKNRKLAVTTVIADRDPCQLKLFKNYKSPGDILERYRYAADMYDIMSGQSIVTREGQNLLIPQNTKLTSLTSTTTKTAPQSKSSTALSSSSLSSAGNVGSLNSTREGAAKQVPLSSRGKSLATTSTTRRASKQIGQQLQQIFEDDDDASLVDYETQKDGKRDSKMDLPSEPTIDESEEDPLAWQAVRASAAAPFFFKPYGPYLDGGIISNNPTLDMLTEFYSYERVKSFLRNRVRENKSATGINRDIIRDTGVDLNVHDEPAHEMELVVSLGTGRGRIVGKQAMIDFGNVASGFATVFSPVELLRSIRAARDLFKKLMHRSCMTDDHILDRAQAWCSSLDIPYFRINPPLANIFSIDDKRDEQLINALWQTKLYMRAMSPQLTELAELLDDGQKQ